MTNNNNNIWFTADLHLGHNSIIKYCNRPFKTIEEMDEVIYNNIKRLVNRGDLLYILGDISMDESYFDRFLNDLGYLGIKYITLQGNHDSRTCDHSLLTIQIEDIPVVLCHYPLARWDKSHFNSYNLHGHCIDLETEILTRNGWKFRGQLQNTDEILTLNKDKNILEYNKIINIIDIPDYTGQIYHLVSRGIDFLCTKDHILFDYDFRNRKKSKEFEASELSLKTIRLFRRSCISNSMDLNISDDMLRLLIWITADGCLCNLDLIRIRLEKQRKQNSIRNLLQRLNIRFRELSPQGPKYISFNFTLPDELKKFRLKPIFTEITELSKRQMKIVLEEYSITDGHKYKNNYMIYTSKKEEIDLLQIACIKTGFTSSMHKRTNHGFSKKDSYELSICEREFSCIRNISNQLKIYDSTDKYMWCVRVENKTIITRRNGKIFISGNCHGRYKGHGKQYDVGVDNNGFYPVSWEQVKKIMKSKPNNEDLVR